MSADWYFMKRRWFGWFGPPRKVGPFSDHDLLERIDRGEVTPETLLMNHVKTKRRWVKMSTIAPAYKHWRHRHREATNEHSG